MNGAGPSGDGQREIVRDVELPLGDATTPWVTAHTLAFDEGTSDEGASFAEHELQLSVALTLQDEDVLLEATLILSHGCMDTMRVWALST
jgi:hypothetical protein